LRGAWRQLPVETVIVAASAAGAIGLVHDGPEVWFLRLLLTGLIATPLAFAAHRLDRYGRRIPLAAGGLAAAGVFAVISATLDRNGFEHAAFHWDGTIAADLAVEQLQLWEPQGRAGRQLVGLTAIVIWRQ
jgi:hypothetical protein